MRGDQRGAVPLRVTVALGLGLAAWLAVDLGTAHGQAADARPNALACMGQAQAFVRDHSAVEIRAERDRWLAMQAEPGEAAATAAYRWCVVAELMRSVGDTATSNLYARAIELGPDAGYELRLAEYLRNARGPGVPLLEQAERHYAAALAGVRQRAAADSVTDRTIAEWATRGLMLTYQQDGFPVLPSRSALQPHDGAWPSVSVIAGARVAFDTNDTPLDMGSPREIDDARRFTSEAMFAASMFRKAQPLRDDELLAIARAPLHDELMARGRIRAAPLGALDLWYRQAEIHGGEITSYYTPGQLHDVSLSELGASFTRALDLYPAFDVLIAASYRRVHRVGVVEFLPDQAQDFNEVEARTVIARNIGPDKLSLGGGYTVMAIPDVVGGAIADRARGRTIASANLDYALNRLLLAPHRLPILHVFAGAAQDDETFGVRVARHRDAYLGLTVSRLDRWDVTVQSSLFSAAVDVRPQDPTQLSGEDPEQGNSQYRTTVVVLRRLIDEDAQPGLPRETLGMRSSMLNAVLTVRHDARLTGLHAFQNVRAGLDLWAKAFVTNLRDTAFLMSAGYENQYFYSIGKDLHIFHVDLRMGW